MRRGRNRAPSPAGGGPERRQTSRGGAHTPAKPRPAVALSPDLRSDSPRAKEGDRGALPPDFVLLGEFGRAHGLRGELRVKSYTADPLAIGTYGPLTTENGRQFTFVDLRPAAGDQPDLLVARVEGVGTREAAEALNRLRLHVARERLRTAEDDDEFLLADLVGLRAQDEAGQALGIVTAVPNFGGGDLLEIALPGTRRTVLVPFTKAFVPQIDIAAGCLVVAAPELFAEPERDDGPDGEDEPS
jgi:16S rRNA processing protein RimM